MINFKVRARTFLQQWDKPQSIPVLILAYVLLISPLFLTISAQSTASFGSVQSSLSTTSNGVVTGTSFAVPGGGAAVISWQVVADGSALSTVLEGSLDNTNWFSIDTQTTATGGLKSTDLTAIKFIRISQVSRTGGTTTTGTLSLQRFYQLNSQVNAGIIGISGGSQSVPGLYWTSNPNTGIWFGNPDTVTITSAGANRLSISTAGGITVTSLMKPDGDNTRDLGQAAVRYRDIYLLGNLKWGSASSVPMLKANSTALEAKLADDSAYTTISAQTFRSAGATFAGLGASTNGTVVYCVDCLANSNPCSGASTGAMAKRLNSTWDCR